MSLNVGFVEAAFLRITLTPVTASIEDNEMPMPALEVQNPTGAAGYHVF